MYILVLSAVVVYVELPEITQFLWLLPNINCETLFAKFNKI